MADQLKETLDEIGKTFEQFKAANDKLLEAKADGKAFSELKAQVEAANAEISKLEQIRSDLDELAKKQARTGGGDGVKPEAEEHRQAFKQFIKKGHDAGLAELQQRATNISVDADGGFAVPEQLDTMIAQIEREDVAMRRLANVITVSNQQYKKLVNIGGSASGWVDEDDARPETAAPKLASVAPFFGELYANPASTQTALDDVFFDVEAWIAGELATEFGEEEDAAFITGNGTKKPKGILAYTTAATADSARAFGTLEHVTSGAAAAITADKLFALVTAMKKGYRNNAMWLANRLTIGALRTLKDGDGNYLWRPGLADGEQSTILGYGYEESDAMPDVAADSLSVAFGDFRRGYTIADVRGVRMLRDPYTNKPYVHFYTTKRVGGGLVDSNAIKLLKTGA